MATQNVNTAESIGDIETELMEAADICLALEQLGFSLRLNDHLSISELSVILSELAGSAKRKLISCQQRYEKLEGATA